MPRSPRWLVLAACLGFPGVAGADPLQPDRPGQSDPAYLVGRGTAQIEMGGTFEGASDAGDGATWNLPEPLLRFGVLERAEARIATPGFVHQDVRGGPSESAGGDLTVSTKVLLAGPARSRPATSLELGLSLPTGGRAVTSGGYDPYATLLASWALGERFSLDANLGLAAPTQGADDSRRVFQVFAAASLGVALAERTGAFLEYYATLQGSGRPDEHAVDGGLTYDVTDDVQLDVSGGVGLSRAAPDFFVGAGIAWRLRTR